MIVFPDETGAIEQRERLMVGRRPEARQREAQARALGVMVGGPAILLALRLFGGVSGPILLAVALAFACMWDGAVERVPGFLGVSARYRP